MGDSAYMPLTNRHVRTAARLATKLAIVENNGRVTLTILKRAIALVEQGMHERLTAKHRNKNNV